MTVLPFPTRPAWHGTFDSTDISEVNIHGRSFAGSLAREKLAQWIREWPGWSEQGRVSIRDAGPSAFDHRILELESQVFLLEARIAKLRKRRGRRGMVAADIGRYEPPKTVVYQADWTGVENWLETMKYCEEGP